MQRSEPYLASIEPRRAPHQSSTSRQTDSSQHHPTPRSLCAVEGIHAASPESTGPCPCRNQVVPWTIAIMSSAALPSRSLSIRKNQTPPPCHCLRLPSSVPDDFLYCRLSALALYTLFHLHLAPMVFVPFCRPCSWYSSRQTSLVLRAHARASKAGPRSRSHAHQGLLASGCLSDKLHKVVRSASSFQRALGWLIYPHIHPVPDGLGLPSSLSIYPSPPSSPPCHPIGLLRRQRRRYTADLVPKPRLKSVQSLKSLSSEPRLLGNIAIPPELSP